MTQIPDSLRAAIQALMTAPSWQEKGNAIRRHPEVTSTPCLLLMTEFLAEPSASDSADARFVALLTRTLLERCRSHGVDVAVAEINDLAPFSPGGDVHLSAESRERLDEMLVEELIAIYQQSDLDDPVEAHYAVARADEALGASDDPELDTLLHLIAGTAWQHLMDTESAAVAGHRAVGHLRTALAAVDAEENPVLLGSLHNALGLVLLDLPGGDQRGNLHDAVESFEAALRVRSRHEHPLEWAATTNNLAMALTRFRTHDWVERTEQAITYFEAALEVETHDGRPRDVFRAYLNLGTAHARLGTQDERHIDAAMDAYAAAIALPPGETPTRERAACLLNRAVAFRDRGAADNARDEAEEALTLMTPATWPAMFAIAHEIIGSTYAERWPEEAANTLKEAIAHYEQASSAVAINEEPEIRRRVHQALGDAYLALGDLKSARTNYAMALSAHETLYQAAIGEVSCFQESGSVVGLYDRDAYAHLRCGLYDAALLRLEAGRARGITARLALDHVELGLIEAGDQATFTELRQQIAGLQAEFRANVLESDPTLRQELADATRRMRHLLDAVHAAHPDALPRTLTIDDFKATVPAGGALVYLVVTGAGGAALVVPHDMEQLGEENMVLLDNLTVITVEEMLWGPDGWFSSYLDPAAQWQQTIIDVGHRLWDLAMGPLHDHLLALGLNAGAPIVLIPPGGLSVLPLHAAWRVVASDRRAFADHWTVSYGPSAFSLSISGARAQAAEARGALLVVNPTDDLPGTVREADAIETLLEPVTRLDGADATPAATMECMAGKAYVHFACHGSYSWRDPLRSGLELAGGGRFTLADALSEVDLAKTRLVTLSACETGIIDLAQSPDDYIGFPAGFLQAGAAAVLSTLWPIDDVATAVFVEGFYRAHLVDGQSPAAALRTASRQLRATPGYDHPYFWAAFTLTGV